MILNIPNTGKKRVVVIGGGFAGISLIKKLDSKLFQTVLVDKNNYHQFQPLIYQVASSGLEAASICFPFRRIFQKKDDFYFLLAQVQKIDAAEKIVRTSQGDIKYDYLVVCAGATTNFRGNANMEKYALPMKSVEEAIYLRNRIIENGELSTTAPEEEREAYYNVVIVGAGPSGVEIAGVFSEMCKHFDVDYNIHLVSPDILGAMSAYASKKTEETLKKMGVKVHLGRLVNDYVNNQALLDDGTVIKTNLLIYVSGIKAVTIDGIPQESIGRGGRIVCDPYMKINGMEDVYCAGDIAITSEPKYPNGHPQMAQVAMQEASLIAKNLNAVQKGKPAMEFRYRNLGSMATIGRNKAVADLGKLHFGGFPAWMIWMFIHLRSILGVRNKVIVLIDWIINYFNFLNSMKMLLFKGRR